MGVQFVRYKRPSGTRWVEHQVDALGSIINSLPIFIGWADHQIANPHNKQKMCSCLIIEWLDEFRINNSVDRKSTGQHFVCMGHL